MDPVDKPIVLEAVDHNLIGLLSKVFEFLWVFKAIPPLANGKSKAGAFNIIVPISGKKKPYDPETVCPLVVAPKAFVDVLTPALPDINWNILPESQ